MIGHLFQPELHETRDPSTGRRLTRLTGAPAHSNPLYYFVASITSDARYLVFQSERTGKVQLYRLDLESGEIGQLSDGHTRDAGWAIWCEWHLDGIYNHLSALHPANDEVYYFQDEDILATNVHSFANRKVAALAPGRMPIGQSGFSPDGSFFAFIHADRDDYTARLAAREAANAGIVFTSLAEHEAFREGVRTTLSVLDTRTGTQRVVIETDFHFHHATFLDADTIALNHPRGCHGMWTVRTDGSDVRHLRPADAPGAHGASIVHQIVTEAGIAYEAVHHSEAGRTNYLGRYDPANDTFVESRLPVTGYVHVGRDPAGRFWCIECDGERHELLLVDWPETTGGGEARLTLMRTLGQPAHQQRRHAHPFLSDDRKHLFFTDRGENGFSQIYRMDVADLTGASLRSSQWQAKAGDR